ncbi:MAG: thiamine phosphate synthase [Planctomycetes bacterium]|nr:thiamine phosphate synthase [Planctomycetota bacterium]
MPLPGRLYLLFTPQLCLRDPLATLEAALEGGVDLVQWRSKEPDRAGFEATRERCQARGVPLIVNDDVMLAMRRECAGAHVGQDDMDADAARKLMFGRLLGVSTHDPAQIRAAHKARADYIGFGPCHPSATKGYEQGLGYEAVNAAVEVCRELELPLFAIGGITPANLRQLAAIGVRRAAVSSYVLQHEDPTLAVRELRRALPR